MRADTTPPSPPRRWSGGWYPALLVAAARRGAAGCAAARRPGDEPRPQARPARPGGQRARVLRPRAPGRSGAGRGRRDVRPRGRAWDRACRMTSSPAPDDVRAAQEAEWHNSATWHGGILGLYYSKRDPRAFVPKRNPGMGVTINFARPLGVVTLAVILLIPRWGASRRASRGVEPGTGAAHPVSTVARRRALRRYRCRAASGRRNAGAGPDARVRPACSGAIRRRCGAAPPPPPAPAPSPPRTRPPAPACGCGARPRAPAPRG